MGYGGVVVVSQGRGAFIVVPLTAKVTVLTDFRAMLVVINKVILFSPSLQRHVNGVCSSAAPNAVLTAIPPGTCSFESHIIATQVAGRKSGNGLVL